MKCILYIYIYWFVYWCKHPLWNLILNSIYWPTDSMICTNDIKQFKWYKKSNRYPILEYNTNQYLALGWQFHISRKRFFRACCYVTVSFSRNCVSSGNTNVEIGHFQYRLKQWFYGTALISRGYNYGLSSDQQACFCHWIYSSLEAITPVFFTSWTDVGVRQ